MSESYKDFSDLATIEDIELPGDVLSTLLEQWARRNFTPEAFKVYTEIITVTENENLDEHYGALGEVIGEEFTNDDRNQIQEKNALRLDKDGVTCILLEQWAKRNLSRPSFSIFAEIYSKVGMDLFELEKATGKAILNEIILNSIDEKMETIMDDVKEGKIHVCGREGFDAMKGDNCPACTKEAEEAE